MEWILHFLCLSSGCFVSIRNGGCLHYGNQFGFPVRPLTVCELLDNVKENKKKLHKKQLCKNNVSSRRKQRRVGVYKNIYAGFSSSKEALLRLLLVLTDWSRSIEDKEFNEF